MCKPPDRFDFIYETIAQRIIAIMNRQVERDRHMEHVTSLLAQLRVSNTQNPSPMEDGVGFASSSFAAVPPLSSTGTFFTAGSTSFNVNQDYEFGPPLNGPSIPLNGLGDMLKSLPLPKVKICVETIQAIMKRVSSLNEILVQAERQNSVRNTSKNIEERINSALEAEREKHTAEMRALWEENIALKNCIQRQEMGTRGRDADALDVEFDDLLVENTQTDKVNPFTVGNESLCVASTLSNPSTTKRRRSQSPKITTQNSPIQEQSTSLDTSPKTKAGWVRGTLGYRDEPQQPPKSQL
ncbi:hypothetical protein B0T22DRAFT_445576 [Podospora appendiculata]|uniref:Uncharacterized protein n=1 Tax=Podospora appendiculata TaxID=314037 RepID=A0AAE1C7B6_9PEZI|nr:hypothetical protein B0T22DRAFT_445576 [Podospora appendiculata]